MKGTQKQVVWANDVKNVVIKYYEQAILQGEKELTEVRSIEKRLKYFRLFVEDLKNIDDARFWIDNYGQATRRTYDQFLDYYHKVPVDNSDVAADICYRLSREVM